MGAATPSVRHLPTALLAAGGNGVSRRWPGRPTLLPPHSPHLSIFLPPQPVHPLHPCVPFLRTYSGPVSYYSLSLAGASEVPRQRRASGPGSCRDGVGGDARGTPVSYHRGSDTLLEGTSEHTPSRRRIQCHSASWRQGEAWTEASPACSAALENRVSSTQLQGAGEPRERAGGAAGEYRGRPLLHPKSALLGLSSQRDGLGQNLNRVTLRLVSEDGPVA